jgi:hypothetical protein
VKLPPSGIEVHVTSLYVETPVFGIHFPEQPQGNDDRSCEIGLEEDLCIGTAAKWLYCTGQGETPKSVM